MVRITLLFCLTLSLVACGHRSSAPRQPPVRQTATVTAPNFGEGKPVDFGATPPQRYPVHGIDISVWQGQIDWRLAQANGVSFVFMKATEGSDHADPGFAANWRGAAAAGVARGAYHFFYHCSSAALQARWFEAHVPRASGTLPPVLDMEWTPRSPTCPNKRPASEVQRDARVFLSAVSRHYGQRPIIYTTLDFYNENRLWQLSGVDFWLRSVAAHPSDAFPGQHWLIWQYSGTGTVPGIAGKVDLNAFAGSAQSFRNWLAARG